MSHDPPEPFDTPPLEGFDGVARLFPLPNVVLFPNVLLPLHIFEPRYRQMVADAMADNRLITMVLLGPGREEDYEGNPPICHVGCIGRIVRHEPLPDGRSNLILHGLQRVRVGREQQGDRLYRTAMVTLLEDCYPPGGADALADQHRSVRGLLRDILKLIGRSEDARRVARADEIPLGQLCDIAAYCLSFDISAKQALLEGVDVTERAETLLVWMRALLESYRRGLGSEPDRPAFSLN